MIRLNGKYKVRVSNQTALFAALILVFSTFLTLQGNEEAIGAIADQQPVPVSAASSSDTSSEETGSSKLNLRFLLFRHN